MVFEKYAQYYDLLYQEKDYQGESNYVMSLLSKFKPEAEKLLEFGSGSGIHARILANAGFKVYGIEKSQQMIDLGEVSNAEIDNKENFSIKKGDCTNTYIDNDFDAVISLFHVFSYQTSDDSVIGMLKNAYRQLKKGGVLIFDFWYAPAVWTIGPTLKVKRVQNDEISITRIAEPKCSKPKNIVEVNYQTFIKNRSCGKISEIKETHIMRAFNINEIVQFAKECGFVLLLSEEWITGNQPCDQTWGVCSILQKK